MKAVFQEGGGGQAWGAAAAHAGSEGMNVPAVHPALLTGRAERHLETVDGSQSHRKHHA